MKVKTELRGSWQCTDIAPLLRIAGQIFQRQFEEYLEFLRYLKLLLINSTIYFCAPEERWLRNSDLQRGTLKAQYFNTRVTNTRAQALNSLMLITLMHPSGAKILSLLQTRCLLSILYAPNCINCVENSRHSTQ
jgi:hypothetical protein